VVRWMADLMRLPAESSGILLGDGTMANILGLAVARYSGCGFDVRRYGLYGGTRRLTVYGSGESEGWAQKGLELLGLGRNPGAVSLRGTFVSMSPRSAASLLRTGAADYNRCV